MLRSSDSGWNRLDSGRNPRILLEIGCIWLGRSPRILLEIDWICVQVLGFEAKSDGFAGRPKIRLEIGWIAVETRRFLLKSKDSHENQTNLY